MGGLGGLTGFEDTAWYLPGWARPSCQVSVIPKPPSLSVLEAPCGLRLLCSGYSRWPSWPAPRRGLGMGSDAGIVLEAQSTALVLQIRSCLKLGKISIYASGSQTGVSGQQHWSLRELV